MSYPQLPAGGSRELAPQPAPHWAVVPAPEPDGEPAEQEDQESGLAFYWRAVRRRKWLMFAAAALGLLAGYLATLPQAPVYQARTSLEILGINENFLNMRDVNPTLGGQYSPEFDLHTQVKILQSESLIDRVGAKLNAGPRPPVRSAQDGDWREALGLAPERVSNSPWDMIDSAARSLKIRAQPNTRLIEVYVNSGTPKFAADFANTLTDVFIEQNLESRWQATQNTGEFLGRQMQELRVKLQKSEAQLQSFASASGLGFISDRDNVFDEKLRQMQQELSRAEADRVAKQSRYELAVSGPPDSLPEVLDSATFREYQVKLAELRRQVAELSATLTPNHPRVLKASAQAASMQSTLEKERANIVGRIRNEFEAARRREILLASNYAAQIRFTSAQSAKIAQYQMLKREVDTTRQLYESMLQRVKEAGIASALRASNIRIVDRARIPERPYRPKPVVNAAVGLMAGMLLGFVVAVMRERSDTSIQQPGQSSLYLNASEFAVIPSAEPKFMAASATPALLLGSGTERRNGHTRESGELPRSLFADSFRAAVTSILLSGQNGAHPRVLVITSPSPGEGKTTVAANLAVVLAEINRSVLLIDGDLRRPGLHALFGCDNSCGLGDILAEQGPVQLHVQQTKLANLSLLSGGGAGNTRLLYSPRLAELIAAAREQADMVLIDTPPMLHMPDARVLGRCADGAILVIRSKSTLPEAGTRVLGTILNDWNPRASGASGFRRYYDSYRRYYERA